MHQAEGKPDHTRNVSKALQSILETTERRGGRDGKQPAGSRSDGGEMGQEVKWLSAETGNARRRWRNVIFQSLHQQSIYFSSCTLYVHQRPPSFILLIVKASRITFPQLWRRPSGVCLLLPDHRRSERGMAVMRWSKRQEGGS